MLSLKKLQNKHSGETCIVIGNGPSLNDIDLKRLSEKYPTFGSNRIYLFPFVPTYYAICDGPMAYSCLPDIQGDDFSPEAMFLSRDIPLSKAILVNYVVKSGFSFNPGHELVIGGTVTYVLLQLAYYMGFKTVVLVGVDHDYPNAGSRGVPGTRFIATGEDTDHFHSGYFANGMVYNRPELKATERYYDQARLIFENNDRKIVNASTKSRLLVYDRVEINDYY